MSLSDFLTSAGKAIGAVEESPEAATGNHTAPNAPQSYVPAALQAIAPIAASTGNSATYEAKLRERLDQAQAGANNVIGQLQSTISALSGAGCTDQDQCLRMAVTVLGSTLGISLQQIVDAYTNRQGILTTEAESFNKALAARGTDIAGHQNAISDINAQIQKLTAQRDTAAAELVSAKTSIEQGRSNFDMAIVKVRSEIDNSLAKLRTFQPTTKGKITNA